MPRYGADMPNEHGYLTDAERAAYRPPPCAECGGPVRVGWVNHADVNKEHWWSPGKRKCLTDGTHNPG